MLFRSVHQKRISYAFSIAFSMLEFLSVPRVGRFHLSTLNIFSLADLQYFHFLLDTMCRYLSNKIGFIPFGVRVLKLSQFSFRVPRAVVPLDSSGSTA